MARPQAPLYIEHGRPLVSNRLSMRPLTSWRHVRRALIAGALVVAIAIGSSLMAQNRDQHREFIAVELERSGGQVPTIRQRFRIDAGNLSQNERDELKRLITEADFFRQPARIVGTAHPDAFEYRLTVQTKDGSHSVTYHDDDGHSDSIDSMADWVRARDSP
jgi:hypothetical protein